MTQNRTCEGCKHGWLLDYGYSNYTVEGTTFACGKLLHPEGSFDRFYGEDWRLSFAEECFGFEPGEAIWVDVDEENLADAYL